jgi:hypothetical protein
MMTKTADRAPRIAVLDSARARYNRFLQAGVAVCRTEREIENLYAANPMNLTWLSWKTNLTDLLLRSLLEIKPRRPKGESILTIEPARPESLPTLRGLFESVVGDSPNYKWLPYEELLEVLINSDLDLSEHFLAAAADPVTKTVSLIRGDRRVLVVPFSLFEPSGNGVKPDFSKLGMTDFGRTVSLGDYEASADAILYEIDPDYRRKTYRERQAAERSFGASLRRLRKQKKLRRTDFAPLAAKTIARIERNEITKPHGKTLEVLGQRLGVRAEDIEAY